VRALLVSTDSTIPNLFLMKMSAYAKQTPDGDAGFSIDDPSHAFISCILSKNRQKALGSAALIRTQYPNASIDVGGTGVDVHKTLHTILNGIDRMFPDYSIYPKMDYSLGFTTRGCIRNCPFCVVPEKEGKFRIVQHPSEFHDPKFKKIRLLDNNINADKAWFMTITDWMIENKLKVDFDGLDVRLFDKETVERLAELRWSGSIKIAFDDMKWRPLVEKGICMMKDAGISPHRINTYVYCDSDECYDDAVARCMILKGMDVGAYAMLNIDVPHTQRMRHLKRWTDRKTAFYGFDIADYRTRRGKGVLADDRDCV